MPELHFEAFVWDESNGMRAISDVLSGNGISLSGWQLQNATGVSADGLTIVGDGINPAGQGEAWIAPWPSDRAITIKAQGGPIGIVAPKEGVPFNTSQMGITKGTKHRDLAEKYLNFALSAECQKRASEAIFIGPTNRNVKLAPDLARDLGIDPASPLKRLPPPDFSRIAVYRDGWVDRWNREIR